MNEAKVNIHISCKCDSTPFQNGFKKSLPSPSLSSYSFLFFFSSFSLSPYLLISISLTFFIAATADYLLSLGTDINRKTQYRNTSLIITSTYVIYTFLKDGTGATVLIMAAYYNKYDCCEYLIKKGANLNIQEAHGDTALTV